MFCSLQLALNPTIVYHSMFYLLLSHRSCKTICHNPSAASLCCIWNDSSIRCLHFIDHNIALCWIPGNILQPFPLFSSPKLVAVMGLLMTDFSNYWAPGRCIPIWWCVRTSGMYPQYPPIISWHDLEKMMSHQWMEWGTPSPVPTPNTKFHIVGYISVYYIYCWLLCLYI